MGPSLVHIILPGWEDRLGATVPLRTRPENEGVGLASKTSYSPLVDRHWRTGTLI